MNLNKIQQYVQQVCLPWPGSSSKRALSSASKSGDSGPAFQFYYNVCETLWVARRLTKGTLMLKQTEAEIVARVKVQRA